VPRERAARLIERYGSDTVAFQAMEPGLCYWFHGDDAAVAYQDTGGAWVAVGGPFCASERRQEIARRFCEAARKAGRRPRFFAVDHPIGGMAARFLGEQPEWDPAHWQDVVAGKRSLREQLRRARAKGVTITRLVSDEAIEARHSEIEALLGAWQRAQRMAPMSFLVSLAPFAAQASKRYFIAEHEGRVVAVLVAIPIPARNGWFFEDLLRHPAAPNGTTELLFDSAMRWAQSEGAEVISYGLAALSGADVSPWLARIRDATRWLYDFQGLRNFKAKLVPSRWRPSYLAYPEAERGIRAVIDSLTAFASGSWVRFGLRTIAHRAPTLCWILALLLVPWLALLERASTQSWFPGADAKNAWLLFDVGLFALLSRLAIRWDRRLAALAASAATLDAVVGTGQLVAFNAQQSYGIVEYVFLAAGFLAPIAAAGVLWLAVALRPRLYLDGG
jgi:phosphatidylglycerol lysyltransferase